MQRNKKELFYNPNSECSPIGVIQADFGLGSHFHTVSLLSKIIDDERLLILVPPHHEDQFYSVSNSYNLYTDKDMHGVGYDKATINKYWHKTEEEVISLIDQYDAVFVPEAHAFVKDYPLAIQHLFSSGKRCVLSDMNAEYLKQNYILEPTDKICDIFSQSNLTDREDLLQRLKSQKYFSLMIASSEVE